MHIRDLVEPKNMSDHELQEDYQLAFFLLRDRSKTIHAVIESRARVSNLLSNLRDNQRKRYDAKEPRASYRPFNNETIVRRLLLLSEIEKLQLTAERTSMPQDNSYWLHCFIQRLVTLLLNHNSFHTAVAMTQIFRHFHAPNTLELYDLIADQRRSQSKDPSSVSRIKDLIMKHQKDRFGELLQITSKKPRRFISHRTNREEQQFISHLFQRCFPFLSSKGDDMAFEPTERASMTDCANEMNLNMKLTNIESFSALASKVELEPDEALFRTPAFIGFSPNSPNDSQPSSTDSTTMTPFDLEWIKNAIQEQRTKQCRAIFRSLIVSVNGIERIELATGTYHRLLLEDCATTMELIAVDDDNQRVIVAAYVFIYEGTARKEHLAVKIVGIGTVTIDFSYFDNDTVAADFHTLHEGSHNSFDPGRPQALAEVDDWREFSTARALWMCLLGPLADKAPLSEDRLVRLFSSFGKSSNDAERIARAILHRCVDESGFIQRPHELSMLLKAELKLTERAVYALEGLTGTSLVRIEPLPAGSKRANATATSVGVSAAITTLPNRQEIGYFRTLAVAGIAAMILLASLLWFKGKIFTKPLVLKTFHSRDTKHPEQSQRMDSSQTLQHKDREATVSLLSPSRINSTMSSTISERVIVNAPLNGRNVLDLARLPSVLPADNVENGGAASTDIALSISGGRNDSHPFVLDSSANNDLLDNSAVYIAVSEPRDPGIRVGSIGGTASGIDIFIAGNGLMREARFPFFFNSVGSPAITSTMSFRIPTPVFGAGLIENIDDRTLVDNWRVQSSNNFGVGGSFNRNDSDGTITRFGWKAQNKSLLLFAGEAYNVEMGVSSEIFSSELPILNGESRPGICLSNTTPEDHESFIVDNTASIMPVSEVQLFALFMRSVETPKAKSDGYKTCTTTVSAASVTNGRKLFNATGCIVCHTPNVKAAKSDFAGDFEATTVNWFSDFEIHHMGTVLVDNVAQGNAGGDQFRTAPLWGVGQRIFLLHDSRCTDLLCAIEAHNSNGGEATFPAQIFGNNLTPSQQQDVLNFLRSL